MKRIAYEWGGIACAALAVVILAYTVVSLFTDLADFKVVFGDSVQIGGARGQLSFADAVGNGPEVDGLDLSTMDPPISSDINATVRGYGFRCITFADGIAAWYLRVPLLVLVVILALIVVVCFTRLRRIRRDSAPQVTLPGD
jgi:hypothetical protein